MRRALDQEAGSAAILQQTTACRVALDGLIADVIEDHIRDRVVDADNHASAAGAAHERIGIVHSYLT